MSKRSTHTTWPQNVQTLKHPRDIQDFLNSLGARTDDREPIVRSPMAVLRDKTANCMEGALLAAAILMKHGEKPLLLDLRVGPKGVNDVDHVVALFQRNGCWGAISKTSHAVLRYREPIYRSVRELALSYFHEYFTDDGKKNLRSFSRPFNVSKHAKDGWITSEDDLYEIASDLDDSPHENILTPSMARGLRRADQIEITAGKLKEKN